jgi:hypothetical protein
LAFEGAVARRETGILKIVLLSSIPGCDVDLCAEELRQHAEAQGVHCSKVLKIEDFLLEVAKPLLAAVEDGPFSILDVVRLALPQLADLCQRAFEATLGAIPPSDDLVLLTFHPVLFHQGTSEFAVPYKSTRMFGALQERNLEVHRIVSIHDDIYDVYSRLVAPQRLFPPHTDAQERDILRDIGNQLLLLDWRDRELAISRALAPGFEAEHLLFHAKGRIASFWRTVWDGQPCVYFSHPISQPRCDMLGIARPPKCMAADKDRGVKLRDDCQRMAKLLSEVSALVEPTAIDELRINNDEDALAAIPPQEFRSRFLPLLSERWPLGMATRLRGEVANSRNEDTMTPSSSPWVTQEHDIELKQKPQQLVSAIELLKREIGRQISVRDHVLAFQADVVVAYRPYSLPDLPNVTGGVREELNTMRRRAAHGEEMRKPSIVILHPPEDEQRRRVNTLRILLKETSRMKDLFCEVSPAAFDRFFADVESVVANLDLTEEEIFGAIDSHLKEHKIQLSVTPGASVMADGELAQADATRRELLRHLSESELLKSTLQRECDLSGGLAVIHTDATPSAELIKYIREQILDKTPEGEEHAG